MHQDFTMNPNGVTCHFSFWTPGSVYAGVVQGMKMYKGLRLGPLQYNGLKYVRVSMQN
jgi:hypothetical protein